MRLLSKKNVALNALDSERGVQLVATEPEDMWHANNLILAGDTVEASTIRKVTTSTATGSTASDRVLLKMRVRVTATSFDPAASSLRVSGTVLSENLTGVSIGQYHTLELEPNRAFTVWKAAGWDSVARQTLHEALDDDKADALCAVVMAEGLANICLITDFRTVVKQRVEYSVPRKRAGGGGGGGGGGKDTAGGGMARFFDKTLATLLRAVDLARPRPLLLAGPGFVAQDFRDYVAERGAREGDKTLRRMAKDALVLHASTGHVHSLNEVLTSPEVQASMRDKRFSRETQAMDELYERLKKDDGRAWYGVKPVVKAVEEGAVGRGGGVLLVNNGLFRSLDMATRKKYVALVDKVKEDGGDARVLSSDHESGQRLDALGGIAAMLTYPMPDLDESDEEGEEEEEEERVTEGASIV